MAGSSSTGTNSQMQQAARNARHSAVDGPRLAGFTIEARNSASRLAWSRLVRRFRIAFPAIGLAAMALLILVPMAQEAGRTPPPRDDGALEMVNARYTSFDSADRAFTVTADNALQTGNDAGMTRLESPMADMMLEDGTWIAINATTGLYDEAAGRLVLSGDVEIWHDAGYQLRTARVVVNVPAGEAHGSDVVRGQGPGGFLVAEGFRLGGTAKQIELLGRSKLLLAPPGSPGETGRES